MSEHHKNIVDPKADGIRGNIGIAGLLVAAMGERIGRGFMLPIYRLGKAYVSRIHPRVWAISGILTAILVLLVVVYAGLTLLTDDETPVQADTITVGEALRAPFDLDERAVLSPDTQINDVLPVSFGDFQRVMDTQEMPPFGRLTSCLVNNGTFTCDMSYRPQFQLATYYADSEGNTLEVVVAHYWDEQTASQTLVDAVHVARTFSRVGNYVVDAGEINYFYSTTRDWFSFTWGHGVWLYSISAPTPDALERAIMDFPY